MPEQLGKAPDEAHPPADGRPGARADAPVPAAGTPVARTDGHLPLRDYAALGDGRTVALVGRDGAVDWLAFPALDSPTVFAAVLDADAGGRCTLEPEEPCTVARRYLPGGNVLETVFTTAHGAVRVTDALCLPDRTLAPGTELLRRVDGLSGDVPMAWRVEPCFRYGTAATRITRRGGVPVAVCGTDALAVRSWDAGEPVCSARSISGRMRVSAGSSALLALCLAHQEPLVLPARSQCEARLERTAETWRAWTRDRRYDGPWRDIVLRSALALKLLVHAPSGAVAAAATSSLPEEIGGERNWDYRFSWVRDSAFTLNAFLRLGCAPEAQAYFWWLMHASQLTHPRLRVLYRLDGGAHTPERTLPLAGYRGSTPVRIGNGAAAQLQLDTYGELVQTAWLFAGATGGLDRDIGRRIAGMADLVCRVWRRPDAGIWEVRSEPLHFTQSKMMCWVALDRAADLAARGLVPGRNVGRWRREMAEIRRFVDDECVADGEHGPAYVRAAATRELDAAVLLGVLHGYDDPGSPRVTATIDAVRHELGSGPFVHRYTGSDGLPGTEGAFLPCSFWLAEALALTGRRDEAAALFGELTGLANDVGLYAEEIDPETGAFLGNLPQALTHLALINAATAIAGGERR